MKMIQAYVRPEKVAIILEKLADSGFNAATKMSVLGRGNQRGITIGGIHYDEVLKECIIIVVEDKDLEDVMSIISDNARSGKEGNYGDGKIFVMPVERAYTISSGEEKL